jgi:hypothetical protein
MPLAALAVLAAGLGGGCQTTESKRRHEIATFQVHLEVTHEPTDRVEEVPVYRSHPVKFMVDREPFLMENLVKEARLVETNGIFSLRIQFDKKGTWLLEQYSVANRGRHFVIFSQWLMPPAKEPEVRWIAAPKITQRITDGVLMFTPDATREETLQIVIGLNNVAENNEQNKDW